MRRKPRIFKGVSGDDSAWIVQLPPYGFQRCGAFVGPFATWRAALRWLGTRGGASAGQQLGMNTQQPGYQYATQGLRPVIR